jgi:hypothetical protein
MVKNNHLLQVKFLFFSVNGLKLQKHCPVPHSLDWFNGQFHGIVCMKALILMVKTILVSSFIMF